MPAPDIGPGAGDGKGETDRDYLRSHPVTGWPVALTLTGPALGLVRILVAARPDPGDGDTREALAKARERYHRSRHKGADLAAAEAS